MTPERMRAQTVDSFWFVPALCVAGAIVAAAGLLWLDGQLSSSFGIAFTGGPSAAREILSTIASSTLTLTGLVFSITIVVLQLTSSQFSPRVLRTFLNDRRTQAALGIFLATYVYALVALRAVRGEDVVADPFVPGVTIAVGFLLTLVSVAMFVHYIHHIAQSIRVVTIIDRIAREARGTIERRYPPDEPLTTARPNPIVGPPDRVLTARAPGVLTEIDEHGLVAAAADAGVCLQVLLPIGDFVPWGGQLVAVHGKGDLSEDRVHHQLSQDVERTMRQDAAFGLRQLVDIAEKALSPGINDPTTAEQALDQIHDLLRRLGTRPFPSGVHTDDDGQPRLLVPIRSWDDYVGLGLDEIRHWGASSPRTHQRIQALIDDLLATVNPERRPPLLRQLDLLRERANRDLPATERP